jgi:hypothetical protein
MRGQPPCTPGGADGAACPLGGIYQRPCSASVAAARNQKLIRPDNWTTREFEEEVTRPKLVLVTVVFGLPNWAPLKAL